MAVHNEGFLADIPEVQKDFGLGEQSVLLTEKDVEPSRPYQLTTIQQTLPAAPPISVGGGYDAYSANELSSIISPFTDPIATAERRKKERKLRKQIKSYGTAAPLFAETPTLDITPPEIKKLKIPEPPPALAQMAALGTKPELIRRQEYEEQARVPRMALFPEGSWLEQKEADVQKAIGQYEYTKGLTESAVGVIEKGEYGVNKAYEWMMGSPTAMEIARNYSGPLGAQYAASLATESQAAAAYAAGRVPGVYGDVSKMSTGIWGGVGTQTGIAPYSSLTKGQMQSARWNAATSGSLGTAMKFGGAALSAYSAFNAFKAGDTFGGIVGSISTAAMFIPGLGQIALALNAVNFVRSITGWGRGKPKPGFGGSEIAFNNDTGQFRHHSTYSYNGFNAGGAKRHTDMVVKYLNAYQKELGVTLNVEKAHKAMRGAIVRGGNYLSRVDISPWKDGSGSASEMLERWLSAGVFEGTPTYYDAYTGQREPFQTQQQYEQYMNDFSHNIFK